MGFFQEFFSNLDEPALEIMWFKTTKSDDESNKLKEENRKLKLLVKKLLQEQIREEKRKEIDFDDLS
jgi:hypothetical protein